MNRVELERVAGLVAERNAVDAEIGAITGRPVVAGHLGEWIAAQVFDIPLIDEEGAGLHSSPQRRRSSDGQHRSRKAGVEGF